LTPGVIEVYQSVSQRVAPLEHVVHPEGHVAQKKLSREWHPWSTWCILKGTSPERRRVAPLAHVVRPEGHVAVKVVDGVSLISPKSSAPE
jgi:hypothetical protein